MSETSTTPLISGKAAGGSAHTSFATAADGPSGLTVALSSKRVKHARTVSGTDKIPTNDAEEIAAVTADNIDSFEAVDVVSAADHVCIYLDDDEGLGDALWIDEQFVEEWCNSLVYQRDHQLHTHDFVLGRSLAAYPSDEWSLVKALEKHLKGEVEPDRKDFSETGMHYRIWCRRFPIPKRAAHLVPTGGLQHTTLEDRSFGWMSSLVHAWPPPLVVGPEDEFSTLFSFAILDAQREREVLNILRYKLRIKYGGAFFAMVRPLFLFAMPFLMIA